MTGKNPRVRSAYQARHCKLLWSLPVLLLVCLLVRDWDKRSGAGPSKLPAFSFSFQGYSNSPSGQRWAVLTVTNEDVCDLHFFGPTWLVFSDRLVDSFSAPLIMANNPLPGRTSCRAAIGLPHRQGSWRFQCALMRCTWRDKLSEHLPESLDDLLPGLRGAYVMGWFDTGWLAELEVCPSAQAYASCPARF